MLEEEVFELLKQGEIIELESRLQSVDFHNEKICLLSKLVSVFKKEVENNVTYSVFDFSVEMEALFQRHLELEGLCNSFKNHPSEANRKKFYKFLNENHISKEYLEILPRKKCKNAIFEVFTGEICDLPFPYPPIYIEDDTEYICFTTRRELISSFWHIVFLDTIREDIIQYYLKEYERTVRVFEDCVLFGPIEISSTSLYVEKIPTLNQIPDIEFNPLEIEKTYGEDGKYLFSKNPIYQYGKYNGREKILTIGVPVSNQITTIERCMEGIHPILEQLDAELLVIDNGSTDGTVEVCQKYGARVIKAEWHDNMSEMRNIGIHYALGEWYMSIDDDEFFDDVSDIISFFKSGKYKSYERAVYIQRNYTSKNGTVYTDDYVVRIGKITPDLHFEGRIHDVLCPASEKPACILKSAANHYGFVKDDKSKIKQKYLRNTKILLNDVYERPTELRYIFQLANEFQTAAIFDYAFCFFLKSLSIECENNNSHFGKRSAIGFITAAYLGEDGRLFFIGEMLLKRFRFNFAEKAFLYFCLADLGELKGVEKEKMNYYCREYLASLKSYQQNPFDCDVNTYFGVFVCRQKKYYDRINEILEKNAGCF